MIIAIYGILKSSFSHKHISFRFSPVDLMGQGVRQLRYICNDLSLDSFLERFFFFRIGRRVMIDHLIALENPQVSQTSKIIDSCYVKKRTKLVLPCPSLMDQDSNGIISFSFMVQSLAGVVRLCSSSVFSSQHHSGERSSSRVRRLLE